MIKRILQAIRNVYKSITYKGIVKVHKSKVIKRGWEWED
jgi:hypothetical protein